MQPAKFFPFASAKDVTSRELEEVYKYLQGQLDAIKTSVTTLQAATSAPTVDFSFQIQQLVARLAVAESEIEVLQAQVAGFNIISMSIVDNDNRLVVETPSGYRQILLLTYP